MENTPIRLLSMNELSRHYGGVIALSEVTMAVHPGQIFSLIGPNGAGKTTLFNCVTGLDKPTLGTVEYLGKSITGFRPDEITRLGIGRTFQNIRLFTELTVLDNVKIGRHPRTQSTFIGAVFHTEVQKNEEEAISVRAHEMLEFVGLDNISDQTAGNLSYGDQRRVEIARALATEPRLLLLDEPAAANEPTGDHTNSLNSSMQIREQGVTGHASSSEHDVKLVMQISDWVTVLDHGEKISEGEPADVQNDERVIEGVFRKQRREIVISYQLSVVSTDNYKYLNDDQYVELINIIVSVKKMLASLLRNMRTKD